jgi:hypothetical protein
MLRGEESRRSVVNFEKPESEADIVPKKSREERSFLEEEAMEKEIRRK